MTNIVLPTFQSLTPGGKFTERRGLRLAQAGAGALPPN